MRYDTILHVTICHYVARGEDFIFIFMYAVSAGSVTITRFYVYDCVPYVPVSSSVRWHHPDVLNMPSRYTGASQAAPPPRLCTCPVMLRRVCFGFCACHLPLPFASAAGPACGEALSPESASARASGPPAGGGGGGGIGGGGVGGGVGGGGVGS